MGRQANVCSTKRLKMRVNLGFAVETAIGTARFGNQREQQTENKKELGARLRTSDTKCQNQFEFENSIEIDCNKSRAMREDKPQKGGRRAERMRRKAASR